MPNNSNTYIGWAIGLFLFAMLCLQIRSCAGDTTPRAAQPDQTQVPEPSRPTLKVRPVEVPVETPSIIKPSVKLVDNDAWRVVIGKQPDFFDTGLTVKHRAVLNLGCEPYGAKVEIYIGGKREFYLCGGDLPYRPHEYHFTEDFGYDSSFSSPIKLRIFDETQADKVTFVMSIFYK